MKESSRFFWALFFVCFLLPVNDEHFRVWKYDGPLMNLMKTYIYIYRVYIITICYRNIYNHGTSQPTNHGLVTATPPKKKIGLLGFLKPRIVQCIMP